jgi:hypothetical protein
MNTSLTYQINNEESVKKTFNALMVKFANNISQVLSTMNNNPIAVANAEIWTAELKRDVEVMQEWQPNAQVWLGELRKYNDVRYVVVQSHITQIGWEPPNVPALFTPKPLPQIGQLYPDWVQPTGAQDAYALGDRVRHNGANWESTVSANVWEPGVFGWIQI